MDAMRLPSLEQPTARRLSTFDGTSEPLVAEHVRDQIHADHPGFELDAFERVERFDRELALAENRAGVHFLNDAVNGDRLLGAAVL